jgi:arylsulfatase A-like enzyme
MFDGEGKRVDFPEGRYRVDAQTDFALDYLRNRDGEQPFFLFLSYIEPHHQNDHKHFEGPKGSKERFKDYPVPGDLAGLKGDWREELPDYLGCCASLDENVGRIRAELKTLGLADNTIVIYTSDHACHFRTRNSEYKRSCHESSIRVPMIITGPGFRDGGTVDDLVSLIDLPPTVVAAGGVVPPETMRGRPLQALADGTAEDWPEEVFVQISESQCGRAIRTRKWKYSVRAPGKSQAAAESYYEDFLYDLEADPHERNNLVRDPALAEVRADLCRRLKRRMTEAGEKKPQVLPAKAKG